MHAAHLVGELADAGAQDGLHVEVRDGGRVAGADVGQVQPHRVLRLALQAAEHLIVHHLRQPAGRLAPLLLSMQVIKCSDDTALCSLSALTTPAYSRTVQLEGDGCFVQPPAMSK